MSDAEEIVRIAAKGDGITGGGRHVSLTAPGDRIRTDGSIERGPHHVEPPCRHFGRCGNCQLQHLDDEALTAFVRDRVVHAATSQGLAIDDLLPVYLSPPRTRRRTTLHFRAARKGPAALGFAQAGSSAIVDLRQCEVLHPALFALVEPLRETLHDRSWARGADIALTLCRQGVACDFTNVTEVDNRDRLLLTDFAMANGLARLSIDEGYGPDTVWEPEPAQVMLAGVPVRFPVGGFLQPTLDGEAALTQAAKEWLAGAERVADLFAGLGTFGFALTGANVHAFEASCASHEACSLAARQGRLPLVAHHRDLFRNPLQPDELEAFDAVLLDPPRAGAKSQVEELARSRVSRVVYISCNPSSWARDVKKLSESGFRLSAVKPVGQFRWSTHVEIASLLVRE